VESTTTCGVWRAESWSEWVCVPGGARWRKGVVGFSVMGKLLVGEYFGGSKVGDRIGGNKSYRIKVEGMFTARFVEASQLLGRDGILENARVLRFGKMASLLRRETLAGIEWGVEEAASEGGSAGRMNG
jgi:hypothetical protein